MFKLLHFKDKRNMEVLFYYLFNASALSRAQKFHRALQFSHDCSNLCSLHLASSLLLFEDEPSREDYSNQSTFHFFFFSYVRCQTQNESRTSHTTIFQLPIIIFFYRDGTFAAVSFSRATITIRTQSSASNQKVICGY